MRGKLARQPTGPTRPFAYMARTATTVTERRNGTASTDTVFTETDTDERERNAGN